MNSKNRFLIFSFDAGGANETMAYGYFLHKQGHKVLCYPKGPAINIFNQHIPFLVEEKDPQLQKEDIIITGTSGIHSNYELEITKQAKELNLKVITLLDSSDELLIRFSIDGIKIIDKNYLPDQIVHQEEGLHTDIEVLNSKLIYHKSFYLEYLKSFYYESKVHLNNSTIKKYENRYILLVTEYIEELFGNRYGFNEFDVCKHLFNAISKVDKNIPVLLKTHPAEKLKKYDSLIRQYPDLHIHRENFIIQEAVKYSRCVMGINSSVFKESTLISKPTYSIQINRTQEIVSILPKEDILISFEELEKVLQTLF